MAGLLSLRQLSDLLLILFGFCLSLSEAQAGLSQKYCSDENTGSSDTPNTSIYQSLGNCQNICSANYAYAIVQGQNCWCSNVTPSNQLSIASCGDTCPGYPYENCGSQGLKLYGYLALAKEPSAPSSTSTPSPSTTTIIEPEPPPPPPPPSPTFSSLTEIRQTSKPSNNRTPSTKTIASTVDVTMTTEELPPSTKSKPSPTIPATTPITSQQIKTVSGSVMTAFVTIMPTGVTNGEQQQPTKQKMSSGSVIAIAVAVVIAAVVLLAALILGFCCWRRKKSHYAEDGDPALPRRNTSVLSRSGLLGGGSAGNSSDPNDRPGPMQERRNSKPLVIDQRLNPNAFMQHDDGSATSVVSVQDNRDYTRTLNIRNPDPHPD